jgi:hypothetical protein
MSVSLGLIYKCYILLLNCITSSMSVPLGPIYKCYNIVILNCITSSMSVALGLIYKCYILLLDCIASSTSVPLCLIQILYIVTEWYYYVHCKSQGNESTGKVVTKNGDRITLLKLIEFFEISSVVQRLSLLAWGWFNTYCTKVK